MIFNHVFVESQPNETTVYVVHSQRELDMLSINTPMLICVEDPIEPIVISKAYLKPVRMMEGFAIVEGNAAVEAYNEAHVFARDNAVVYAYDHVKVDAVNQSYVDAYDKTVVNLFSQSSANAHNEALIILSDQSVCNAYDDTNIVARGENRIILQDNAILNTNCTNVINVEKDPSSENAIVCTSRYHVPCNIVNDCEKPSAANAVKDTPAEEKPQGEPVEEAEKKSETDDKGADNIGNMGKIISDGMNLESSNIADTVSPF